MTFTVSNPTDSAGGGGLMVGIINPDLTKIGHVYDLQPYVVAGE